VSDLAGALHDLYARIPLGMRLGLEPMRDACIRTDHPEKAFPAVHVAGTNGKGSVCAMVESIARAQGLRTGLYTSPHLCRFAERIRLDGEPIDDAALASLLRQALAAGSDLSFFETATLAAFLAFREANVDIAIVEVGIGGRLDATNLIPAPRAAAITRIALDHTDRLGPTLIDIAREKAGIAKPGVDLVLGPMSPDVRAAIDEVARVNGATTSDARAVQAPARIGLAGEHQKDNARIAALLGARIGATPAAIEEGLAAVRWPGRLEQVDPRWLLDAAHNPDGAEALARYLRRATTPSPQPPGANVLLFGALGDKDWRAMLAILAPLASKRIYVPLPGAARTAIDPREMNALYAGEVASSVDEAISLANAHANAIRPESLVVATGSMVLVGEVRAKLLGLPRDPPVAL
jgi:dihydrofolate synthase / folylpolyglutamate synthase